MSDLRFNGQCDTCACPLMASSFGTTGYANDDLGRRHCYVCCADHDRAYMHATGRIYLYLSLAEHVPAKPRHYLKGEVAPEQWRITNWPSSLEFKPLRVRHSHGYGFGGQYDRYDVWFRFGGRDWHGVNQGDNQILRCKQLKGK